MKETTSSFLLGLLAGAAAGVVAGILFAPDKGSKTRENLRQKLMDLSEEYGLGIGELIEEISPPAKKTGHAEKSKRKYNRKPKPAAE
jgi:gas vesicle protein